MANEFCTCLWHNVKERLQLSVITNNMLSPSFFPPISGEENSPGWLCGEDEGKTMAPFCCPLLTCHMPVFSVKSPERKVNLTPRKFVSHRQQVYHMFITFKRAKSHYFNTIYSCVQTFLSELLKQLSFLKVAKLSGGPFCVTGNSPNC